MAVMKVAVFWDVPACGLIEIYPGINAYCLCSQGDGLRNVGQFLRDHTVLHPTRQPSLKVI